MPDTHIYNIRARELRSWLSERGFDAIIVATADAHGSEYLPAHWQTREWLTGFTGSAGTAVLTATAGALWTDSRYFLQAAEQLEGGPYELMKLGEEGTPTITDFLKKHLAADARVGFCAETLTHQEVMLLRGEGGLRFEPFESDPFDALWSDRPTLPKAPVRRQADPWTGQSARDKIAAVWKALEESGRAVPEHFFVSDLSEIAWLLNLRGADIEFNPVFLAFLLLRKGRDSVLCVDTDKIAPDIRAYLEGEGVLVAPYNGWRHALQDGLPRPTYFSSEVSEEVFAFALDAGLMVNLCPSPVATLRARKTEAEQAGFRQAMERDGVAMVRFLRWLEEQPLEGETTEVGIDRKLTALRAEQAGFEGLSFGTIAAYGAHGAIVHYEADDASDVPLQKSGLLLLDSGGQYDCGTTDITRTIALGPLTEEERRVYTLVLKGHIELSALRFPAGTCGLELDLAARRAMWQAGYDFGHGTGHGVGSHLCVHEGPHQIRKDVRPATQLPFDSGMVVTDEPGIYLAGRFGVRIENTLLVVADGETPFGRFCRFEPLTLCPIDTRPILLEMLTADERRWLNDYHAEVRRRLLPLLADAADRAWLEEKTTQI